MENADQLDELKRAEEMKNLRPTGASCAFSCGAVGAEVKKVPEASAGKQSLKNTPFYGR